MTDTFAAAQAAGGEAVEDIDNDMVCETSHCVPLVGGLLHSKSLRSSVCSRMRASLVMRSLKRKIIQQRSISEVRKHYPCLWIWQRRGTRRAMVHTNYERNNVPVVQEVAAAWCKACNGERNNVPSLKMEKWNGDATVLWVVEKWGNNSR